MSLNAYAQGDFSKVEIKATNRPYQQMLKDVRRIIGEQIERGRTREQVVAANPLAGIGKKWGNGFLKTPVFTGIVFDIKSGK